MQALCRDVQSNCLCAISQVDIGTLRRGAATGLFSRHSAFTLTSRDVFMNKQPINVEEHNERGLDIGLVLPLDLSSILW